jgi:predicted nucleic acid-binding protein
MLYLLDTNAFSDVMRDNPVVRAKIAALDPSDQVATCTIVRGEIAFGILRLPPGKRRDDLTARAARVSLEVPSLGIPSEVSEHYASIKQERSRLGLAIDDNDAWIAATARHFNATLVSHDLDVQNVPGLVVQDWSK